MLSLVINHTKKSCSRHEPDLYLYCILSGHQGSPLDSLEIITSNNDCPTEVGDPRLCSPLTDACATADVAAGELVICDSVGVVIWECSGLEAVYDPGEVAIGPSRAVASPAAPCTTVAVLAAVSSGTLCMRFTHFVTFRDRMFA